MRLSLRRRILLMVLALGFAPSLVVLVVGATSSVNSVRDSLRRQSREIALSQVERLGDLLNEEVNRLARLAEQWPFAGQLPPNPSLYLFREGELTPLTHDTPFPDEYALGIIRRTVELDDPPRTFLVEGDALLGGRPEYWAAARIPSAPGCWLVDRVPLEPLFSVIDLINRSSSDGIGIVSSRSGLLTPGFHPDEVARLLRAAPGLFTQPLGTVVLEGDREVAYTHARAGAMTTLTEPTGFPTSIVVLKRIEMAEATNALLYGFWVIAIFGIFFVAAVGAFGIWLSGRLVDPILRLRTGFQRLETGDLDFRVEMATGDELEQLARSMNSMAATLQETYRNLASKLLEIDEKARQLAITYEIAKAVSRSLDLDRLLRDIINEIHQLIPVEQSAIALLDGHPPVLTVAFSWPPDQSVFTPGMEFPVAQSIARGCLATGDFTRFTPAPDGASAEERILASTGARLLCVVPLVTPTGPVGALLLADPRPEAIGETEEQILRQLAASLATAVGHSRLYKQQADFANELERLVQERTAELQRAQEQLVQAEKLMAFGELAANVAHEINNPLSIIKNYVRLLETELRALPLPPDTGQATLRGVTIIGEEIDRIARIVGSMRSLRQRASPVYSRVDINGVVRTMIELFRLTFQRQQVTVDLRLDDTLPEVFLCEDHVRQILINLLRNATDAMDGGGRLLVETRANTPTAEYFVLRVRDTGPGIPEAHLTRIFDPFFTTKREGKGSGLGLSISYGLASAMGGRIEAASPPEGGALLTVILPYIAPEVAGDAGPRGGVQRVGDRVIIG
jgi:signal transduction histidine kinase